MFKMGSRVGIFRFAVATVDFTAATPKAKLVIGYHKHLDHRFDAFCHKTRRGSLEADSLYRETMSEPVAPDEK
ncbi:uncharacterized protein BDR25DRAFT_360489 [Lindgomyces ingoldianus]|uniref:Uncharacterized protein n=1 Tax=Lindgomyces ingoldianus TaxID=673940 RepID=A0ACB6QG59_9PLEO|nr:uncharacterized protein BDR25DRAFT_360489 [Lindgomyces ingoldianus]KAF2465548.1 hypothetical protein BDR25DRAFT_360489 [Lindgomyces ingoldianus]